MFSIAEKITGAAESVTESVSAEAGRSARKLWRHPIVLGVLACIVLTCFMDGKAVSEQPRERCQANEIAVSVPGVHILGIINSIVRGLPFTKSEPAIRDVVAAKTPDVPISAVVKANGLSGPMGVVPSNYGGVRCLSLPKATKIAQETLILPGPGTSKPKASGKRTSKPAPLTAVPSKVSGNVAVGKRLAAARGWTGGQWTCLYTLWNHESEWDSNAKNPTSTAYGVAQFLSDTWGAVGGKKTANPITQISLGIKYISQRYGTPCNAWNFWWNVAPHRPPFNGHWY